MRWYLLTLLILCAAVAAEDKPVPPKDSQPAVVKPAAGKEVKVSELTDAQKTKLREILTKDIETEHAAVEKIMKELLELDDKQTRLKVAIESKLAKDDKKDDDGRSVEDYRALKEAAQQRLLDAKNSENTDRHNLELLNQK